MDINFKQSIEVDKTPFMQAMSLLDDDQVREFMESAATPDDVFYIDPQFDDGDRWHFILRPSAKLGRFIQNAGRPTTLIINCDGPGVAVVPYGVSLAGTAPCRECGQFHRSKE